MSRPMTLPRSVRRGFPLGPGARRVVQPHGGPARAEPVTAVCRLFQVSAGAYTNLAETLQRIRLIITSRVIGGKVPRNAGSGGLTLPSRQASSTWTGFL